MPESQRPRILFVAESATMAHPARSLVLARTLMNDFEVHFASRELPRVLLGELEGLNHHLLSSGTTPASFIDALSRNELPYTLADYRTQLTEEQELLRSLRPQVVVGDARLTLGLAAKREGIQSACLVNANWSPYSTRPIPMADNALTGRFPEWLLKAVFRMALPVVERQILAPLKQVYRECATPPPIGFCEAYCWGSQILYLDTPWFLPTASLPQNHFFVGPALFSMKTPLPEELRVQPSLKYIYVSMGSSGNPTVLPNVIRGLLNATKARDLRVVVSLSGATLEPDLRAQVIVADYVPIDDVIRSAQLVVSNGGMGTNYYALVHGVPSLMITANTDQEIGALAMCELGAGLRIRASQVRPTNVSASAAKLLMTPPRTNRLAELAALTAPWVGHQKFRQHFL